MITTMLQQITNPSTSSSVADLQHSAIFRLVGLGISSSVVLFPRWRLLRKLGESLPLPDGPSTLAGGGFACRDAEDAAIAAIAGGILANSSTRLNGQKQPTQI